MTTYNHTPIPVGAAAQADLWNQRYRELDEAIGLNQKTGSDPTTANDNTQGYEAGVSKWLNTTSGDLWFCTDDTTSNALWAKVGQITDPTDLPAGIDAAKIADGSVSNTEFQYLNGVTSAIQTQIDGKVGSPIETTDLPSNIPATKIADGTVSDAEFQYIGGLTSDAQTQLDDKASASHKDTHKIGGSDAFLVTDLLDAVARQQIKLNGTTIGARRGINFIPISGTASITMSVVDSSPDEHVNVQIGVSGGGLGTDELTKVGISGTPSFLNDNHFSYDSTNHIYLKNTTLESGTYYVSPSGSDSTGDGSLANPFATINHVLSLIPNRVDHDILIFLTNGTHTFTNLILENKTGSGLIRIMGNQGNPTNVILDNPSNAGVFLRNNTIDIYILGFSFATNDAEITAEDCKYVNVGLMVLDKGVTTGNNVNFIRSNGSVWSCTLENSDTAIRAIENSYIQSSNNSGNSTSYGIRAYSFSRVYKVGTQPTGTTGNEDTLSGGQIA